MPGSKLRHYLAAHNRFKPLKEGAPDDGTLDDRALDALVEELQPVSLSASGEHNGGGSD